MTDHHVIQQLQNAGLDVTSGGLNIDGRLHRVSLIDGRRGKKNGWYVLFNFRFTNGDHAITGSYGNWSTGYQANIELEAREWSADERREYAEKLAEAKIARDAEQRALHEQCAARAAKIWNSLPNSGASPYLRRKRVLAYNVRFTRTSLVIPIYNASSQLVGLQFIGPDGSKKFLTGTPKQGAWHMIPDNNASHRVIAIAEGYATGATIYKATGWPVAVAFDAGNLQAVALAIKAKYPNVKIIICGDRDESGVGQRAAISAATAVGGVVALPDFTGYGGEVAA